MTGPRNVPFRGGSLAVREVGSGRRILVLHGGPGLGHGYLLEPLARLLADRFTLVFHDQRGCGDSTAPAAPALTLADLVEDVEIVRRAIGEETVTLLGHSFGGLLAMAYGIRHSERVRALVLVDPDPASRARRDPRVAETVAARLTDGDRREIERIRADPGWASDPDAFARYFRVVLRTYVHDRATADTIDLGLDRERLAAFHRVYREVHEDLGDYDLHADLAAIRAPVLVLHGESGIFSLEGARAIADALPDGTLRILPEVGHFPHVEAPGRFVDATRAFLG